MLSFYLTSFLVCLFVKMKAEVADSWQVVELKVLAPEDGIGPGFAGGAGIQHVIQTQFTIIALFGREFPSLYDPQLQNVVDASTVVLGKRKREDEGFGVLHAGDGRTKKPNLEFCWSAKFYRPTSKIPRYYRICSIWTSLSMMHICCFFLTLKTSRNQLVSETN